MISVIIPTYKGARGLPRAIESVLNQKKIECEIIIVDDNNPDSVDRRDTEKVMKYYEGKNIKYLKHLKNKNGSAARNTGINSAKGDTISFLDDDDFYFCDRLIECEKKMKIDNSDIVYTDVLITKDDIPCGYTYAKLTGNLFLDLLKNENIFGTGSNLFIKHEAINKFGGFDEKLVRQQDYEFLLRMFSCGARASNVGECLVVKAMNGVNNGVSYEELKKIKYGLLEKYSVALNNFDKKVKDEIIINQYKELLHTAEITNNKVGIIEQCENLKIAGYKYKLVDKAKEIILTSSSREFIQGIAWKINSKKIIDAHRKECDYAMNILGKDGRN